MGLFSLWGKRNCGPQNNGFISDTESILRGFYHLDFLEKSI